MANLKDKFTKNGATIIASAITAGITFLWSQYSQHEKDRQITSLENKILDHEHSLRNNKEDKKNIYDNLKAHEEKMCINRVNIAINTANIECQDKLRDLALKYRKR